MKLPSLFEKAFEKLPKSIAENFVKDETVGRLIENAELCVDFLNTEDARKKTKLEIYIEQSLEEVFEKNGTLKELKKWFDSGREAELEADNAAFNAVMDTKLAEFKTAVIDPKFQEVLDTLAKIDKKIGQ